MQDKPIGEQLRAWRAARGLSQVALAEKAGVVPVLVARLELGQTDPRLSTLRKLAAALGVTLVELVDNATVARRTVAASAEDRTVLRRARQEHARGQYVTLDRLAQVKRPVGKRARGKR
jgi:transcriptional regulator with XRE-family HTH domain